MQNQGIKQGNNTKHRQQKHCCCCYHYYQYFWLWFNQTMFPELLLVRLGLTLGKLLEITVAGIFTVQMPFIIHVV